MTGLRKISIRRGWTEDKADIKNAVGQRKERDRDKMNRYGVIMAGGGGTRFWPLSRREMPKQFLNLTGRDTLVNETIDRIVGNVPRENIYIVTNVSQSGLMGEVTSKTGRGKDTGGTGGKKYGGMHRLCGGGYKKKIWGQHYVRAAFGSLCKE